MSAIPLAAPSWVLRWDPRDPIGPRVSRVGEPGGPVSVFRDRAGGFVVFDGYLFDTDDLTPSACATEAAAVAAAWDRWGESVFDRLRGGFALARWDPTARRLTAGRDAMGLAPCYYWSDGRLLLVSPSLDALLAEPEVSPRFNRLVLAEYLGSSFPACQVHDTFYEDVRRVPPGTLVRADGRGLDLVRYWDPLPADVRWASEEERAALFPSLARAVDRCLEAGGDCIALSGGFDSISIAALAADLLRDRPPLHALSLRFPGAESDESAVQRAVARRLGMPQILVSADEHVGDALDAALVAQSRTSPSPLLSQWQPVYGELLGAASDLALRRVLLGTGGDELFYVDSSWAADCVGALDLRGLWTYYRACQRASPGSGRGVARAVFWGEALRPWLGRVARAALEELSPRTLDGVLARRRGRRTRSWLAPADPALLEAMEARRQPISRPARPLGRDGYLGSLRHLCQSPLLQLQLAQGHSWARARDLTLLFPYFDRDVVELCLRTHPAHLLAGGLAKAPLRRLLAERLPGFAMQPRKVSIARLSHEVMRVRGQAAWQALGGPRMLAELGLVQRDRVCAMMDRHAAGDEELAFKSWLAFSTELWLRARSDTPFILHTGRASHAAA